ncbi:MAG: hypothetical protein ACREU4_00115 [Burkholderiales bacterium]
MKRVVLHIDRLVLRGIERGDAAALSAGVQAELQHLLAAPEAAQSLAVLGHTALLRAGTVRIAPTQGAAAGQAIASGILRSMKP